MGPESPEPSPEEPGDLAERKLRRVLARLNLVEVLQSELLKTDRAHPGPPTPAVRRLLAELAATRAELEALGGSLQPQYGSLIRLYEAELERERDRIRRQPPRKDRDPR